MELLLSLASPHAPAGTSSYSQSFCCWQCRRLHARQLQLLVSRVSSTASSLPSALTAGWHQFVVFFQEFTISLRLSSTQKFASPCDLSNLYLK